MDTENKNEKSKSQSISESDSIAKKASYFVASVFGIGFIKFAPGTIASLVTLPFVWLLMISGDITALLLCGLIVGTVGYAATAIALRYSANDDPSFIVADEVTGQMFVFIVPLVVFPAMATSLFTYIAGFLLFRLFDIWKPLNVGQADKYIKGAFGVMLDDIIAGFYASVVLLIAMWVYGFFMQTSVVI